MHVLLEASAVSKYSCPKRALCDTGWVGNTNQVWHGTHLIVYYLEWRWSETFARHLYCQSSASETHSVHRSSKNRYFAAEWKKVWHFFTILIYSQAKLSSTDRKELEKEQHTKSNWFYSQVLVFTPAVINKCLTSRLKELSINLTKVFGTCQYKKGPLFTKLHGQLNTMTHFPNPLWHTVTQFEVLDQLLLHTVILPPLEDELLECGSFSISVDIPCSMVSIVCCWGSVVWKHCRKLDNESRNTAKSSGQDWKQYDTLQVKVAHRATTCMFKNVVN